VLAATLTFAACSDDSGADPVIDAGVEDAETPDRSDDPDTPVERDADATEDEPDAPADEPDVVDEPDAPADEPDVVDEPDATGDAEVDGGDVDATEDEELPDAPDGCIDRDNDGYGTGCALGDDCDDRDRFTHPTATQICDGNDNTCELDGPPEDEVDSDGDFFVECVGFLDWQGDDPDILGGADCAPDAIDVYPGEGCLAVFLYEEAFEDDDGGWTTDGTLSSWEWGMPAGEVIDGAGEGDFAWVTNLDGEYNEEELSYLYSPVLNMAGLTGDPVLRFMHHRDIEAFDGVILEWSTDGAETWDILRTTESSINWYNDVRDGWWNATLDDWVESETILAGAAGNRQVQLRFVFESDTSVEFDGFGVDRVVIFSGTVDAGVVSVDANSEGCGFRADNQIVATIANAGTETIANPELLLEVDGEALATETYEGELLGGEIVEHVFEATADLTSSDNLVRVTISAIGDTVASNDSVEIDISELPGFSGLPYFEDFELDEGAWVGTGSWSRGTPGGGTPAAPFGDFVIGTSPSGTYGSSENSNMESPCMDLSTLDGDPTMVFQLFYNTESCCDEGWLEQSLDGGDSWTKIPSEQFEAGGYNDTGNEWWEGNSEGWHEARVRLDGTGGEGDVRLRFMFSSDGSVQNAGFAMDDVFVGDLVDLAVASASLSEPNCTPTDSELVTANVRNLSASAVSGASITLTLNGIDVVTDAIDEIAPGETHAHEFSVAVDLSAAGSYEIVSTIVFEDDGIPTNDSYGFEVDTLPSGGNTLPYSEGFEGSDGAWFTYGDNSSWEHGRPGSGSISDAASGNDAWVTGLTGPYNNNEVSFLESPCLDFSSATADPTLNFSRIFNLSFNDEAWVEASIDGGLTWRLVPADGASQNWYNSTDSPTWVDSSDGWEEARAALRGTAGLSDVRIRFAFITSAFTTNDGFGVDALLITDEEINDVAVLSAGLTDGVCRPGRDEPIEAMIENRGTVAATGLQLGIRVDGGEWITEEIPATIESGETLAYTSTAGVDLGAVGLHDVEVRVLMFGAEDARPDNNRTQFSLRAGFPYLEDFESGAGGWFSYGTNNTWGLGHPTGAPIASASSGDFAWNNNPSGVYLASELSYLESPCFDFSTLIDDPDVRFRHAYETESCCDEGWLEMSTNGGDSWNKVTTGTTGWYNDTVNQWWDGVDSGWHNARARLNGAAGHSDVRLRFVFSSDGSVQRDGFAVDDVTFFGVAITDVAVEEVNMPSKRCQPSSAEVIEAVVHNVGTLPSAAGTVTLYVDEAEVATESLGVLEPDESVDYVFTATADLSAGGEHTVRVEVTVGDDSNPGNDSMELDVFNQDLTVLPYSEDFEAGAAEWMTYGASSSWALATPAGTAIADAGNGAMSWVTNEAGDYNVDELSYLEAPCFDFTDEAAAPALSFLLNFQTETCCDHMWLESSVDGGDSWSRVSGSGASNWYTNTIRNWWSGDSAGWLTATNNLEGLQGEGNVRFRFAFESDDIEVAEGVAVDLFEVQEAAGD